MQIERWKNFLRENKWIIGAILFFILWKFFLIHTLWQGRLLPPEPDDSYTYIAHIATIANCPGFHLCSSPEVSLYKSSGFFYFTYRIFFGFLAKLTHLSPQAIYHVGFYLGTLFLALILSPFIKIFSKNKYLIAWTIFFLSFYNGLGETHGFYWVVPSFFSLLLLFLLAAYTLREDLPFRMRMIIPLALLYTLSHPTSVFLVFIIPLHLGILSLFTYRIDRSAWKRTIFVVALIVISSLSLSHILSRNESKSNIYSVEETVKQAQTIVSSTSSKDDQASLATPNAPSAPVLVPVSAEKKPSLLSQKTKLLQSVYFHWVFPHWVFVPAFFCCLFVLVYKKQFSVLSFYIASFFFFIAATFLNPLGYRSGIVLWPLTYVLFAFGSWYGIEIITQKATGWIKALLLGILCFFLALFFLLNATYSFIFNENLNVKDNYFVDPALIQYLAQEIRSPETITLSYELQFEAPVTLPALRDRTVPHEANPDYRVFTDTTKIQKQERSSFFKTIKKTAEYFGFFMQEERSPVLYAKPEGYQLEKSFGIFDIYKRTP